MRVCIVGLGYIGTPTAAMLALGGHDVVGSDIDVRVLDGLRDGARSVAEEPVRRLVREALTSGRLTLSSAVPAADAYLICVPTPTIAQKPDLRAVAAASAAVATAARPGSLIILESTVPPGTTERFVAGALRAAGKDPNAFALAHCPERVIPGRIVEELRDNDRVVGGRTRADAERAGALYASFCQGAIHLTDCTTAELVKVVENTFRDVNIAFANELALLAEELGVDAWETIRLANNHPRVNILDPGPGVGGHCIPVDPHFLSNANPFVTELIQTARRINERMPHVVARRVLELVPLTISRRIALLGAAYKADVDDTRESPTSRVDELLREAGYETTVFDPVAQSYVRPLAASLDEAVSGADAVVLMTGHAAFRAISPAEVGRRMRTRVVVDTRAFFDLPQWQRAGFVAYSLGGRRGDPRQQVIEAAIAAAS